MSEIPMHWLQALRGKSVLFTRAEALEILGRAHDTSEDEMEHALAALERLDKGELERAKPKIARTA